MKKLRLYNFETTDKESFYWCITHAKMAPADKSKGFIWRKSVIPIKYEFALPGAIFRVKFLPRHLLEQVHFSWYERPEQGC